MRYDNCRVIWFTPEEATSTRLITHVTLLFWFLLSSASTKDGRYDERPGKESTTGCREAEARSKHLNEAVSTNDRIDGSGQETSKSGTQRLRFWLPASFFSGLKRPSTTNTSTVPFFFTIETISHSHRDLTEMRGQQAVSQSVQSIELMKLYKNKQSFVPLMACYAVRSNLFLLIILLRHRRLLDSIFVTSRNGNICLRRYFIRILYSQGTFPRRGGGPTKRRRGATGVFCPRSLP